MFEKLYKEVNNWATETFGKVRAIPALCHLKKECDEAIEALQREQSGVGEVPATHSEYADLMILLMNSAGSYGLSPDQLLFHVERKLKINRQRTWKAPDENGIMEHVK